MAGNTPSTLLITRNFPPLLGGMERLNRHLLIELSQAYKVGLVGPRGARKDSAAPSHLWECSSSPPHKFLACAAVKAVAAAKQLKPQIVIAGSGLTAPIALFAARWSGAARTVVYAHGLDLAVPNAFYRAFWHPALRRVDRLIANSQATAALAADLGIPKTRIAVIPPGVTLPTLDPAARRRFRKKHGLGQRPLLLSVGRLTARKGVREFVTDVLPHIVAKRPEICFLIVGDTPDLALHARAQTAESILAAAARMGIAANVRCLGWHYGNDLSDAYQAADVHVFPVRNLPGNPEGFGMVAIEAAAHGLPTIAFAVGGVPDAVADEISGRLVPAGDNAAFTQAVIETLSETTDPKRRTACRGFAKAFSWTTFGEKLRRICRDIEDIVTIPQPSDQLPHAVLDLPSRCLKAIKIERLLDLHAGSQPIRMLEIGTGSGGIAHYFATHPKLNCEVEAVDIEDNRQLKDGHRFTLVKDVHLPFLDHSFDVVISNHVIEHVGDFTAQRDHLSEMYRVLKPGGLAYLALPNRWQWKEPHYRLAGLRWLPERWRSPYLRLRGRGQYYDCRPLTLSQIEALLHEAGFSAWQQPGPALRLTYELERPDVLIYRALLKWIPDKGYAFLRGWFPTLIFILRPAQ